MKIHIYSFATTDNFLLDIYKKLEKKDKTVVFHVSTHIKSDNIKYKSYSIFFWFIYRVFIKILKYIKIPYYKIRHIQEWIFDTISSKKLKEGVIVLTTNGWIPKTLKKNKELGGKTILFAGNPCDLEISRVLEGERKRVIQIKDIYNFKPRLKNYKTTITLSNKIIAFNDLIYKSFSKDIPSSKLVLVPDFFPLNKELFSEKNISKNKIITFCYIGHTILLKGLHILLDAWEKAETKNTQLLIGGNIQNELKPYIINKIKALQNVLYLGKIADLNSFYRSAHFFICPSILDAGPMTITEALYCKLPVIASENCGNSYLIEDNKNGFIYYNNSSDDLSKRISLLIKEKDNYEFYSKNAFNTIQTKIKNHHDNFFNVVIETIENL